MNLWTSFQALVDVSLIVALIICFSRLSKVVANRTSNNHIEELKQLQDSLEDLLEESRLAAVNISKEIEEQRVLADETITALSKEKRELHLLSRELSSEVLSLREELGKTGNLNKNTTKDKYSEVIKLAEMGLNAEEISKKTSIPLGEIELALNLRR